MTLDLNAGVRLAFVALCVVGIRFRAKAVQTVVAFAFFGLLVVYIGLVFWSL